MSSLYLKSIQIIKEGQSPSGAYIASPNFPTYHYCWLRDGSFIAHAMDVAGETESAEAFFRWVGRTIQKYGYKVAEVRRLLEKGLPIGKDDTMHTRFTLDGEEDTSDSTWGNFQVDGYGTWLWALAEHVRRTGNVSLLRELAEPIDITLQYLELVWKLPNYDCWEEHPEYLHPYSLATVYGGLAAVDGLVQDGLFVAPTVDVRRLANQVSDFLQKYAVGDGVFVKHIRPANGKGTPSQFIGSGVDASLLGLAIPYHVFPLDDPLIVGTIQAIERDLHHPRGGVYRYKEDVYYGGGEWILLAAWLGWYDAQVGNLDRAEELLHWIEAQADGEEQLAEQISDHILAPDQYEPWLKKWGPVAKPLLWSHAMYIILVNAIQHGKTK
ncbi:glucoamylase [Longilinea arvoryzae]|uniref:Glucoamylase n=1 Tax=Longilinea arvoryzae TaxID=360412 RepID=A0A0S7BFK6_9CHLR|nr:glycoside hydrolase family 15 protein [Longilinea arvoryzae]GAP12856.1 glucoamylase [Longilinea arvoryzae]